MKMVIFPLFIIGIVISNTLAEQKFCYNDVVQACSPSTSKMGTAAALANCNAKYGAIDEIIPDLQTYVTTHITRSFEYLLMSTHYANYEKNRAGFEKLFRDLSDSKWDTAIELIKYITKRGGRMNFSRIKDERGIPSAGNYELYELESVAKALDLEKSLAMEAFTIHNHATRRSEHDPEISSYIEEEFVHKHAKNIRQLSGFASDLTKLLSTKDHSLALYLFDNYLQKSL